MDTDSFGNRIRDLVFFFGDKKGRLRLSQREYQGLHLGLFILTVEISDGFPFDMASKSIGINGVKSRADMINALLKRAHHINEPVILSYNEIYLIVKVYWAFVYFPRHIDLSPEQWERMENYISSIEKKLVL